MFILNKNQKLILLHSNDMHGDFLGKEAEGKTVGGLSLLSGYIDSVRAENENVIYAVAGDMFRGSVIDSEYKGISTTEIMNLLAPDVVTIGNHEADYGIAHLLFIEKCAKFPIINANMYIKTTHTRLFRSSIVLKKDGMKILFIGVVTPEVLNQTRTELITGALIDVSDPLEEICRICDAYRSTDIDLTVLLTHIGVEADISLARSLPEACGVDIIIGGHSHTLMDKPIIENGIPIVQAGMGTDQIGRFELTVDTNNNCLKDFTWNCVTIDSTRCNPDLSLEMLINKYKNETDKKFSRVVTRLLHPIENRGKYAETAVGNLFADILRSQLGLDIMLVASGSLRKESLGPIVVYSDLTEMYVFDDKVFMISVTGSQLLRMFEFFLGAGTIEGRREFYQVSVGIKAVYDKKSLSLVSLSFKGEPVDRDKLYTVGLQEYHYIGLEQFFGLSLNEVAKNAEPRQVAGSALNVVDEYLSANSLIDSRVNGRITFIGSSDK